MTPSSDHPPSAGTGKSPARRRAEGEHPGLSDTAHRLLALIGTTDAPAAALAEATALLEALDMPYAGLKVAFRFSDIDLRATCECGWTATGDAPVDAFRAWWAHRRDKHPEEL